MPETEAAIAVAPGSDAMRERILDEALLAFGVSKHGWGRRLVGPLLRPPSAAFARLAAGIEADAASDGLPEAARRLLPVFVEGVDVHGAERIPTEGPLLIACNHPGAYDVVAVVANLPRRDVFIVVSDVQFYRLLPTVSAHMIFSAYTVQGRMATLRGMLRRLQEGAAVLIFASGQVDPDPALLPGAEEDLALWSASLELVLRKSPGTRFLPAIASGVLARQPLHSPLLRLQREEWQKRKLAEVLQVMQQLVFKRNFHLRPRLSFGEPLELPELLERHAGMKPQEAIVAEARQVLATHLGEH
jgi:hypothetical protein